MTPKRVLTIQDLACVGRCSLTVALPVLSAYGLETSVLPTAILSNHTAFAKWTSFNMTHEISGILEAWKENGFGFDAFLVGYLGSAGTVDIAKTCFRDFSNENAKIIIDPAFGDNGKLYGALDMEYVSAIGNLIESADIILPNLTEACYLAEIEYRPDISLECARKAAMWLSERTDASIVITGIESCEKIGELIYSDGEFSEVWAEKLPRYSHGTGDLFAAAFTALYLQGSDLAQASACAAKLVADSIKATDSIGGHGISFENVLRERINRCHS